MKFNINLRDADRQDCHFIWELANESEVRKVSFPTAEIPWEEHCKWFNEKIGDRDCQFFIIETSDGDKIGQIRFELKS